MEFATRTDAASTLIARAYKKALRCGWLSYHSEFTAEKWNSNLGQRHEYIYCVEKETLPLGRRGHLNRPSIRPENSSQQLPISEDDNLQNAVCL